MQPMRSADTTKLVNASVRPNDRAPIPPGPTMLTPRAMRTTVKIASTTTTVAARLAWIDIGPRVRSPDCNAIVRPVGEMAPLFSSAPLFDPRNGLRKQAPHIVQVSRRIVVVVHQTVGIGLALRSLVHDLPHQLQRRSPMMKTARDVDRGSLLGAVDAPRRGRRGALPIVGAIPDGVRRDARGRVRQDLTVEHIRRNFLRCVDLEPDL